MPPTDTSLALVHSQPELWKHAESRPRNPSGSTRTRRTGARTRCRAGPILACTSRTRSRPPRPPV